MAREKVPAFVERIDANGNRFGSIEMVDPGPDLDPELVRIGREYRAIRVKAGKIMREVADGMGVSVVDISDFERGSREFPDEFRSRFIDAVWREKLDAARDREGRLSVLTPHGGRVDLTADDLRAIARGEVA